MAVFDAILCPAKERATQTAGLGTTTSTAEISIGSNVILALNADQDITVRFGVTGMGAADDTDWRIPANVSFVFDMSRAFTHVRFFNRSSSTAANIWYLPLSKF